MDSFNIINPFTKETLASHPYEQPKTIEEKIAKLEHEFKKKAPIEHTKQRLNQLSQTLDQHKQTIATLISTDMGKPITESIKEVQKCMDCCDYYEENAETIQKKQRSMNHIQEPLGIILGIMPWNYPLWQIIRYLIPSIVVGNACLVKPAFNTYRIAEQLATFFHDIHWPIMAIAMPTDAETETLIGHKKIAGVSFTGSVTTGQIVGQLATKHLKPCVLELGGSDPFIVFKDANIDTAIDHAIKARFTNAGQVCIAAKRFLFEDSIYNKALSQFKEKTMNFLKYGNPLDETTTIGPIARKDLKNIIPLMRQHWHALWLGIFILNVWVLTYMNRI